MRGSGEEEEEEERRKESQQGSLVILTAGVFRPILLHIASVPVPFTD
jgi:hypothetical protein